MICFKGCEFALCEYCAMNDDGAEEGKEDEKKKAEAVQEEERPERTTILGISPPSFIL